MFNQSNFSVYLHEKRPGISANHNRTKHWRGINRISVSDISDLIVHSLDYVNKLFRNNYLINRITSKANKPST